MEKIDVAAAIRTGKRKANTKIGTRIRPPPTPNKLERNPKTQLHAIAQGSENV
tara:strand:+ start:3009 stop:3167 length:159 start_codon:yes stop_codon:yes gene_type:complete